MTPEPSLRTVLRDRWLAALRQIGPTDKAGGYRSKVAPEILSAWVEYDQVTKYPAICVVVTSEDYEHDRMHGLSCVVLIKLIGYVHDAKDCRAKLDELIEDVFTCYARNQPQLSADTESFELESLTTDEGTQIAQPFAQFIMTWQVKFTRRFGFTG